MPCDRFRMQGTESESAWQEMMQNSQNVTIDEFLSACDPSYFTDDYDSMPEKDALLEMMSDDPTSYFAKSTMNGKPVYFIATSGFEYIFTN